MNGINWRWTNVAVNVAIGTGLVAGVMYLLDGEIATAEFAAVEAVMLLGVFFRWRRRRLLS